MVAGDLVNTASRVQSAAEPGAVLRRRDDPARHRADDRLRGRRLLRVQGQGQSLAAARRPTRRLRLDAARSSRMGSRRRSSDAIASSGRSRISSTLGRGAQGAPHLRDGHRRHRQVASRLGVLQVLRRHRRADRVLAPRALPLLRRGGDLLGARRHGADALPHRRGGGRRGARSKLRATLEEHILDVEERGFVEPRLAHLSGSRTTGREISRISSPPGACFFERLAESYPTVLTFEDMQWADESLLDFVEHLLDWSRNHPLSSSRWRGLSCSSGGRPGAPGSGASPRSFSSRSRSRRWRSS